MLHFLRSLIVILHRTQRMSCAYEIVYLCL